MIREIMDWEEESKRFDEAADYYDKYRPSYPKELIEKIISHSNLMDNAKILEVGSGSGKATELFLNKGYSLTCIEPGKNLVAIGEKKFKNMNQVRFVTTRLEDWEVEVDTYDLAISAQAFHWVSKPIGYIKCANALKNNMYLALFWNRYFNDGSKINSKLAKLCKEYGVLAMDTEDDIEKRIINVTEEIKDSNLFKSPTVYRFPWTINNTLEEFMNFLKTGNGYLGLDTSDKKELNYKLESIYDKAGGTITRKFECVLYITQKNHSD